ncbi:MAG TPA: hypothetical protein VFB74_11350 [Kribbellaceae bacterium]|nr:hypothetical protein [Kribbellaceae bacterium]
MFTDWPPGPLDLENRQRSSDSGITTEPRTGRPSMVIFNATGPVIREHATVARPDLQALLEKVVPRLA